MSALDKPARSRADAGAPAPGLSRGYTFALLGLGGFQLLGAAALWYLAASRSGQDVQLLLSSANLQCFQGIACLLVAELRRRGHHWAGDSTLAVAVLVLFAFPLGTALSLVWVLGLRKREWRRESASVSRSLGLIAIFGLIGGLALLGPFLPGLFFVVLALSGGTLTLLIVNLLRRVHLAGRPDAGSPAGGLQPVWILSLVTLCIFYLMPVIAVVAAVLKLRAGGAPRQDWSPVSRELWRLTLVNVAWASIVAVGVLLLAYGSGP